MGRLTFRAAALLVLVCTALTPAVASAAEKKSGSEESKGRMTFKHSRVVNAPGREVKSVVADALRAYEVDRKAGRIAKGDEERVLRERLEKAFRLNRSSEGLQTKKTATGVTAVDLEGRFGYVMLSRTEPDGTTSIECVSDADAAVAFLTGRSRATAERE